MIFDVCQIKNERIVRDGIGGKWVAIGKDDLIAEAEEHTSKSGRIIFIKGQNYETLMSIDYGQISFLNKAANEELKTWELFENGALVGATTTKRVKVKGFLQSYIYDVFQYKENVYSCYEVGLGRKGIFICLYKNDELVAVVDKTLKVVNYKDRYTCYLLNREDCPAVIAYTIQYDINKYFPDSEDANYSVQHHKLNTIQKEILAKYDAGFIEKIKNME